MIETNPRRAGQHLLTWPVGLTVDRLIKDAVFTCWTLLPEDKRSAESVGAIVRPLVERALAAVEQDVKFLLKITGPMEPGIEKGGKK